LQVRRMSKVGLDLLCGRSSLGTRLQQDWTDR
jgi:hypothetical protein